MTGMQKAVGSQKGVPAGKEPGAGKLFEGKHLGGAELAPATGAGKKPILREEFLSALVGKLSGNARNANYEKLLSRLERNPKFKPVWLNRNNVDALAKTCSLVGSFKGNGESAEALLALEDLLVKEDFRFSRSHLDFFEGAVNVIKTRTSGRSTVEALGHLGVLLRNPCLNPDRLAGELVPSLAKATNRIAASTSKDATDLAFVYLENLLGNQFFRQEEMLPGVGRIAARAGDATDSAFYILDNLLNVPSLSREDVLLFLERGPSRKNGESVHGSYRRVASIVQGMKLHTMDPKFKPKTLAEIRLE